MIKLKLTKSKLEVFLNYIAELEILLLEDKLKLKKRRPGLLMMDVNVQLYEIKQLIKKCEIKTIGSRDYSDKKTFQFKISPIQGLILLTFKIRMRTVFEKNSFTLFVLEEQSQIIFKELLTK